MVLELPIRVVGRWRRRRRRRWSGSWRTTRRGLKTRVVIILILNSS